ncbi:MAG: MoxR family ATPase [Crocinitomicaceae bacterium]|nr:MoxR family ATPase [Crocinitomicaceae bacterium]
MINEEENAEALGGASEDASTNNQEGTAENKADELDHSSYMPENKTESSTPSVPTPGAAADVGEAAPIQSYSFERQNQELIWVAQKVTEVRNELSKFVIGQTQMVDLLLTGIFSNGHLLLEGAPGVAKTLSAKVLSKCLDVDFSRIQFTPDMMPSDVIGTSIFNMKDAKFSFREGPIFSNIVLIDEINRAPAKTQAALFEVMEERQITYDGECYPMSFPFLVIATQNPIDQEGTYNLPEAQLDRFLFKVKLDYPALHEEEEILHRYKNSIKQPDLSTINAVFTANEIQKIQDAIEKVVVEDNLVKYIAAITHKTRNHGKIYLGGSPRASLSIIKSAKAIAGIRGRDFVTPDDIQFVAPHVLNHRLIMTPEAEMEGVRTEDVIQEIIKTLEVPR